MKGYIAMQKMDLIADEYIREAEIDADTSVVIYEKKRFWKGLARFMNSPVSVAMLCAVVSLSVLAIIVMAGTGKWSGWQPPAGSHAEQESSSTQVETLPPVESLDAKSLVPEFYQALQDKDMIGKIPDPAVDGGLKASKDPIYIVEEADIYNVTPLDIYEETGAMIFNAGVMVYLWMDGEIYILNRNVFFGSGFTGAVLCDYDQNGTEDIFCGYLTSMSGVYYTDFVVFDVVDKALRHNLLRTPSDYSSSSAIIGCRVFCDLGVIQKRIAYGTDYYDIVKPTGELIATYMPTPEGLVYLKPGATEVETSPPPTIMEIPELVPTVLSQYFETYGFTGGLGQSEFVDGVLGKFSFEGTPLSEFPMAQFDGELEDGGYTCGVSFYEAVSGNKIISINHQGIVPKTDEDSYRYSLTTQVPLEGFALPYDITFGMSFDTAYQQLGLGEAKNFAAGETILYRYGNETLKLIKTPVDPEALTDAYTAQLIFTQNATEGEGKRSITISFGEDQTLYEVEISVSTKGSTSFEKLVIHVTNREIQEVFFSLIPEHARENSTPSDLTVRYFGIFNNGQAIFVDGILFYDEAFTYETVFGYVFEYPTSQQMLFYKNGRFYSLTEAAEIGLLTQTDIEALHSHYQR